VIRPPPGLSHLSEWHLLVLLALTCASLCWSAPGAHATGLYDAIRQDTESGITAPAEARMQRFYSLFRPDLLDARYQGLSATEPPCATSLLAELRAHSEEHTDEQLQLIQQVTNPWHDLAYAPETHSSRDTCVPPEVAQDGLGPYAAIRSSEHFAIHYTPSLAITESRISTLLDYFEESLSVLHDEIGFYPPARIDTYQLLVAVEFIPSSGTGGYTQLHPCGLGEPMAFIVVNSQWFQAPSLLQSLAPHELFHAIQVRYGFDEFWASGSTDNLWFIEASAVYQESVVYPKLTENLVGQADRWAREPWRSLETSNSGGFQYGTFLALASIQDSLGSAEWHHNLWDQVLGRSGYWLIDELDQVLTDEGTSFSQEYGLFVERAATMDFNIGDDFNTPADMAAVGQGGLSERHSFDELPVDVQVEELNGAQLPEFLGSNYILIEGPEESSGDSGLVLDVRGSATSDGEDRGWEVRLVAIRDGEAQASHDLVMAPDDRPEAEPGSVSGTVYLAGLDSTYDGVLLGVSPTKPGATQDGAPWGYAAWSAPSVGEPGFGPVPDDVENPLRGCSGCRAGPEMAPRSGERHSGRSSMLLLVLTLACRRSRRRRDVGATTRLHYRL